MTPSAPTKLILLADDDKDDCSLFSEVLDELSIPNDLTIVHTGEQLIQFLRQNQDHLPGVLFLDLNLPRINGFDCLSLIKRDEKLKALTVVIFTTSNEQSIMKLLYKNGAQYYIRKPNNYEQLKRVIQLALTLTEHKDIQQPTWENFVLSSKPVRDENKY